jgi:Holliday junction resolvasome RuvABC endonuclease subunit
MPEKLDLSGNGKASDFEIDNAVDEIFNILRIFDSPKDAAVAIALAHIKFIKATFPPEYKKEAIDAIDGQNKIIRAIIEEGYQ